jgi:MFS family permease
VRLRSPALALALVAGLLNTGYGALFALLDDLRDEYGISESALGLVVGVGFFAGFIAQTTIAPLADRGHAKQLVVTGLALNVASLLLMAAGSSLAPFVVGRLVMGIGVGMALPAIRRIAVLADPAHIGRNLGRLLSAEVMGFAIGPAIAAALGGPFGIRVPFVVAAAAAAAALPLLLATRVTETADATEHRFAFDLLRIRPFAGAVAMGGAVFVMIGGFDALWSVALDDLGTAEWIANLGISLFALPLVILGSTGGRLAQRHGPFRLGALGLILGAAFMMAYGLVPTGSVMFVVAMFHALSDGLTVSSTGVAVGLVVPADRQAGAQGVLGGTQTLLAGVVAVVAGLLYDHFGRAAAYGTTAAIMLTLVVLGAWLAREEFGLRGAAADEVGVSTVPVPD